MGGSRDSTAFDVNVISEGMAFEEEKEKGRQKWADYWRERRELHDKMLLRCPNDPPFMSIRVNWKRWKPTIPTGRGN